MAIQFPDRSACRLRTRECRSTSSMTSFTDNFSVSSSISFPSSVGEQSTASPSDGQDYEHARLLTEFEFQETWVLTISCEDFGIDFHRLSCVCREMCEEDATCFARLCERIENRRHFRYEPSDHAGSMW